MLITYKVSVFIHFILSLFYAHYPLYLLPTIVLLDNILLPNNTEEIK